MTIDVKSKSYVTTELILLFIVLPVIYYLDIVPIHKVIPLIILFGYCLWILIKYRQLDKKKFHLKAKWAMIFLRFILIIAFVYFLIWRISDYPLLADLRTNRKLLIAIIIYPLLSAFPQELIFREFFFYRYSTIFRSKLSMIVSNVVLFSFAHLYFESWIVIVFTLIGGLIFALTYIGTRSLLVVTIEHTIYGSLVLASGLGEQFYKAF